MDHRDIATIRAALNALPSQCRYHGDRTSPDHYARMTRSEACCDTGIPAHRRKQAEAALAQLTDTDSPGTCDASADTGFADPLGPCILRHHHDGPVHKDANGATWRERPDTDPPPAAPPVGPRPRVAQR